MTGQRFLCDEMLGRFARYLRAAGHDTTLAGNGETDRALLARAQAEQRHFLTRDRRIMEHKAAAGVALVLPGRSLDAAARAVWLAFALDWQHAPFTRCLVDNAPLQRLPAGDPAALPADVRDAELFGCPACRRIYWSGSHTRRIAARLAAWAAGNFTATNDDRA